MGLDNTIYPITLQSSILLHSDSNSYSGAVCPACLALVSLHIAVQPATHSDTIALLMYDVNSHSLLTCSTMDPMRPTDRVFDGPAITLEPSFTTTRRAEARSALSINGHGPPFETPERRRDVVLPNVCRMPLEAARLNRQNDITELLPRCH